MLLNCGVGKDSWESFGQQGDQTVNPKWHQSWIFIERTDAVAPILWPPDAKNWLFGKDSDSGKDWRQEKKAMTKDETVGWHHRLDEHEFEQALGVGDGRGSLECCSPWGLRVQHDWVNELNWTEELGMKKSCLLVAVFQNNNFKINNLWARNIHKDYRAVNDTFYH